MKLKILWMYHDLMDLYGDKGNIQVLKTRCFERGIECEVKTVSLGESVDCREYDLFFMGGGADLEQTIIYEDLYARKDNILEAMDSGTNFLLICGGYQLFGQYYLDQDHKKIDGLGIYDYYTESTDRDHRCIGNIAVEVTVEQETFKAVGFENHGGQTKNVRTPFAKVLKGHGNEFKSHYEGFMNQQVIGTYMHGPLLPKNPKLADLLIRRSLHKRYGDVVLQELDDTLEDKAREVMLKRLGV